MIKRRTLMIAGIVAIVGIAGVFAGRKIYEEYKHKKAIEFYMNSTKSQKPLSNEQIKRVTDGITYSTLFLQESVDYMLDPEDYKDSFLVDTSGDTLVAKENWVDILNSADVDVWKEYFEYVTFTELSDTRDIYTYSDDYGRGCSVQVRFIYPNLDKMLNYDLPVYCAENNLGEVDLSLTSEFVRNYVKDNYQSNLMEQCLQIPVVVLDNGNPAFMSTWLKDLEYFTWLDQYNVVSGKFEKAKLPKEFKNTPEMTKLFNKGDVESILLLLSKDEDFYDEYREIFSNMRKDSAACTAVGKQLLEIGEVQYYPMKVTMTVSNELDGEKLKQFDNTTVVVTCVPYVDYENSFYQNLNLTYVNYADTDGSSVYGLLANSLLECYQNYEVLYEE